MATVMILIGTGTTAWALMQIVTALDAPKTKRETRRSGNYVRPRCGR